MIDPIRLIRLNALCKGRILSWMLLAAMPFSVNADVEISGLDDISLEAWAGTSSDLEGSDTYCVLSCNGSCTKRNPSLRPFDVAAYTSGPTDGAGNFYLSHIGAPDTLLVTFDWTNPTRGTYTMTNYNVTAYTAPPDPYAPGASNCGQADSQNTITIRLSSGQLASALAGTYTQTFSIDMCRHNNNGSLAECVAPVAFSVTLPELIQLTQLDNFVFGSWSGSGDVQATDDFCVFRNGSGGFSLKATGTNDVGATFNLNSGTDQIPFSLEFRQSGAWFSALPGTTLTNSTTGFAGNHTRDCGGGTSHSVRVTMVQNDLGNATQGSYSDTVTLLVQPN